MRFMSGAALCYESRPAFLVDPPLNLDDLRIRGVEDRQILSVAS